MIKIYATGIQDLTVARYFAAMEVSLAGFTLTSQNLSAINGIKAWIEGPKLVAECDLLSDLQEQEALFRHAEMDYLLVPGTALAHCTVPAIALVNEIGEASNSSIVVYKVKPGLLPTDVDTLALSTRVNHTIYFDLEHFDPEWIRFLASFPNTGIVVRTGTEDKPGLKSFDEVDTLFEMLENL